jgi:hypothetical protein
MERLFGEDRRRMKAVGNFFGERPVLKLMCAVLLRAAETLRGITVTEFEARQLRQLQQQRHETLKKETRGAGDFRNPNLPACDSVVLI